jgi:phosphatidylinositol alpha-1,6-mannosyltransferase
MEFLDLVVTQDFYPMVGGAHFWLYEVYKKWPFEVILMTKSYCLEKKRCIDQKTYDEQNHQSLSIKRNLEYIEEINFFSFSFLSKLIKNIRSIRQIAKKRHIRIHVIRSFPEGIYSILFKKFYHKKCIVICYIHGEELLISNTSLQLKIISDWVYKNSDLIISNSKSTSKIQDSLFYRGKLEKKRVVIHPGADYEAYQVEKSKIKKMRQEWGWPSNTVILVSCARMETRKNHSLVIEAISELLYKGLQLGYIIAGDGELKETLVKKVEELGTSRYIKFTGYLSETERILTMASAHIHVMPSVKVGPMIEGFGIVFIEAAAAGIPSIAGNIGGQPEAVIDNVTGFVVDGNCKQAIIEKIELLATNEELRKKMGYAGKVWAQENDWAIVMRKTYNSLAEVGQDKATLFL